MTTEPNFIPLRTLRLRTVRSWWADGLWDFAVLGFNLLLAAWLFVFVRVQAFPSWTWPWPFITTETINPMQMQLSLWVIGLIPLMAGYAYGAYKLVSLLKSRWLASRQGDVRHAFWLKIEPGMLVLYLLTFLGLFVVVTWLVLAVTGSAHYYSTLVISSIAAIMFSLGLTYKLTRYLWAGLAGLLIATAVELFATTPAGYTSGPKNFLDVSPTYGNPALPVLIFAVLYLCTGLYGLVQVLSKEPHAQA